MGPHILFPIMNIDIAIVETIEKVRPTSSSRTRLARLPTSSTGHRFTSTVTGTSSMSGSLRDSPSFPRSWVPDPDIFSHCSDTHPNRIQQSVASSDYDPVLGIVIERPVSAEKKNEETRSWPPLRRHSRHRRLGSLYGST